MSCLVRQTINLIRGCRGRDRMVVGFTTTYAINAYHHWCCEFESRSGRGVQHYVIKFVSDLRLVSGFLGVFWFTPPIKLTATIQHHQENKQTLYSCVLLYFLHFPFILLCLISALIENHI